MAVVFGRKGLASTSKKQKSAPESATESRNRYLLLQEEEEGEEQKHQWQIALQHSPVQSFTQGHPKIYLEVAIFRGAFFGVDHQGTLEFELHPQAAPRATRRLLEDCAAGRLSDRRFVQISKTMAVLDGGDLREPEPEIGEGLTHTEPGMLSISRGADSGGYVLTLSAAQRLDRSYAAFARLSKGKPFLKRIADAHDSQVKEVRVVSCGEMLQGQVTPKWQDPTDERVREVNGSVRSHSRSKHRHRSWSRYQHRNKKRHRSRSRSGRSRSGSGQSHSQGHKKARRSAHI